MNKRRTDLGALIFGVIFVSIGLGWFAAHNHGIGAAGLGLSAAALLILMGVAGIIAALRSNARP